MPVPLSQTWSVVRQVVGHALRGERQKPLVLMLEPLLRCNLACPGCGKIRQRADLLEIVEGLVARGRFVYLCTNAVKLEAILPALRPHRRLVLSIHLDGPREVHDAAVGRSGVYDIAMRAIRAARVRGFRVATNTTLFAGSDPQLMRDHFDRVMTLGVEGLMVSPGYAYDAASGHAGFLTRERTQQMFRQLLQRRPRTWRFNQTPLFLAFLQGAWELECTPWGTPTFSVQGWQRPCYLIADGYCATFQELLQGTDWQRYGRTSGNPQCRDCMVHCGYEPSAVRDTLGSLRGLWATLKFAVQWSRRGSERDRVQRHQAGGRETPCGCVGS